MASALALAERGVCGDGVDREDVEVLTVRPLGIDAKALVGLGVRGRGSDVLRFIPVDVGVGILDVGRPSIFAAFETFLSLP